MQLPLLTEYDPVTVSEGRLDPLGIYAISDALAVKLVPGIRERMSNPRFLTSIAVSLAVCSGFDEDAIAVDGISPPWQVFEWHVVEGLVKTSDTDSEIKGLPGRDKALQALRDKQHLTAKRYLKTASVFGYHGVYRLLAKDLDIGSDGTLGESGYELLITWEKEQGLDGFHSSSDGPGNYHRKQLQDAVSDGLKRGIVDRSSHWGEWAFFKKHLSPNVIGSKESEIIFNLLRNPKEKNRKQVVDFLLSEEGQNIWSENQSEKSLHNALKKKADSELLLLINAIQKYEEFSRLLQDAFEDMLFIMTRRSTITSIKELSDSELVKKASNLISNLFPIVSDALQPFQLSARFEENFNFISEKRDLNLWIEALLEHHRNNQSHKPPDGKRPWVEMFDAGGYVIRTPYRREKGARTDEDYLYYYRTFPLWEFMQHLNKVPQ